MGVESLVKALKAVVINPGDECILRAKQPGGIIKRRQIP